MHIIRTILISYSFSLLGNSSGTVKPSWSFGHARSTCIGHCRSQNKVDKLFVGVRRVNWSKWECKCFSFASQSIIGVPNDVSNANPAATNMDCSSLVTSQKTIFDADTALKTFLTISKSSLQTSDGIDNNTVENICNSARKVDLATVYLAKVTAKIHMSNLINKYVHNTNLSHHSFPTGDSTPATTYIPNNVGGYSNLEQTFWTIMNQFNGTTEPTLRAGREQNWCHYHGVAVYEHCKAKMEEMCPNKNRDRYCSNVWKYFMQGCNRVLSRNPDNAKYQVDTTNPWSKCTDPAVAASGNSIYYLHRGWSRSCQHMAPKIPELANTTIVRNGWMELVGAATGFNQNYKIAGTTMKYECGAGFALENGTNPEQSLSCAGSLRVDMSHITICERKSQSNIMNLSNAFFFSQKV